MSKIEAIKIDKSNLALQIVCAVIILGACFVSKSLVLVAGVASMAYMFSNAKWEQKFAFFMFMLSFSPIFKFNKDQTSLFMFLRLATILSYIFQYREKFSFKFITILIAFFAYSFVLSELYDTDYLVPLINIAMWTMLAYIIANTLKSDLATPVIRSLVNGVIVTGIIGLFINDIPALKEQVNVLSVYGADGALVNRYAGFWVDPNFFTVLLIASIWFVYFEYNKKRINFGEFLFRCVVVSFIGLMTMSKSCILLLVAFWIYVIVSKNDIKTAPKVSILFFMIFAVIIFLWKNPYWLSDMFYRFNKGEEQTTFNTVTTGRTDLWLEYAKRMLDDFSWITGHGVYPELFNIRGVEKGSHNTYIQMIYNFGLFGTTLYVMLFRNIYLTAKNRISAPMSIKKQPEKMALLSVLITMFFLDGIYIEMYYYMLPLTFVYLLKEKSNSDDEMSGNIRKKVALWH